MADLFDIGYDEALGRTLEAISPLPPLPVGVLEAAGLVTAAAAVAAVDCPSVDSALKDGFAVLSSALKGASEANPVRLEVAGKAVAGGEGDAVVSPGSAVEITTGAELPRGADAVLAVEFTRREGEAVLCLRDAGPGRNVMSRGSDVPAGETIAGGGTLVTPAMAGLMAAGGIPSLHVHPLPRIGIAAIGDEVVLPGGELGRGQLFASNAVTLAGWLGRFRFTAQVVSSRDREGAIGEAAARMLGKCDALLTSGGVWKSDRDLTVRAMEELGGEVLYHRVRIGPGKAVALVLVDGKPVFCLPGGPASNEMSFLQLALPGLLKLAGRAPSPFPLRPARLESSLEGVPDWTQFYQADLRSIDGEWTVAPIRLKSRLRSQARANALLCLPEGKSRMESGEIVPVQELFPGGGRP